VSRARGAGRRARAARRRPARGRGSRSSSAARMTSWTCASTAVMRVGVGGGAARKRISPSFCSSYAPSVTRQWRVNVEAEVAAEALYDSEHARVQGLDRRQAVLLLHAVPHVLHHRPRQPPGDGGQQRRVVAQTHRHRAREREHPLPITPPPAARGPPATPRPRPSAGPCTRDSSRAICRRRAPAARRRSCGSRSARSRARSPRSPRSQGEQP
jgi:hypothetical protein